MHFRYFCLLTHYRKPLLFTFENLNAAKITFERLKRKIIEIRKEHLPGKKDTNKYESNFKKAINDDLNISEAIQVFWKLIDDSSIESKKKLSLLFKFDEVLGLNIKKLRDELLAIPEDVQKIIEIREELRKNKEWAKADILRQRIKEQGFDVEDTSDGPKVEKLI